MFAQFFFSPFISLVSFSVCFCWGLILFVSSVFFIVKYNVFVAIWFDRDTGWGTALSLSMEVEARLPLSLQWFPVGWDSSQLLRLVRILAPVWSFLALRRVLGLQCESWFPKTPQLTPLQCEGGVERGIPHQGWAVINVPAHGTCIHKRECWGAHHDGKLSLGV